MVVSQRSVDQLSARSAPRGLLFILLFIAILTAPKFTRPELALEIKNKSVVKTTNRLRVRTIPLLELIGDSFQQAKATCGDVPGVQVMEDTILPEEITHTADRRIPRVVHVTGKSRCMTPILYNNLNQWKFENHSFYFHDDEAVDKLLSRHWPEFPHLQLIANNCMISGAAKADLWRYLAVWEFGGIYTDIDNAPGPRFNNGTAIPADTQSYFVQEKGGFLSQYFFAAEPKHPIMFMAVQATLQRLMELNDVGGQYVPFVTGPGALTSGMHQFMQSGEGKYHKPRAGLYTGVANRTVLVVGNRRTGNEWVGRSVIRGRDKRQAWTTSGMVSYQGLRVQDKVNVSCFKAVYGSLEERTPNVHSDTM